MMLVNAFMTVILMVLLDASYVESPAKLIFVVYSLGCARMFKVTLPSESVVLV